MTITNEDWQILMLLHDESSEEINEFISKNYKIVSSKIEESSYKQKIVERLENIIRKKRLSGNRVLTLAGSGGFHHLTYGLCKVFADAKSNNYGYIHFDLHDDTGEFISDSGIFGFGAFVNHIFTDTNSNFLFYVGCGLPPNNQQYKGKVYITKARETKENSARRIMSNLRNIPRDVYISMDLDVLTAEYVHTGFKNGLLSLEKLLNCLEIIKKQKNIIGADIIGYEDSIPLSGPVNIKENIDRYNKNKKKSIKTYKAIIDCLLER